MTDIQRIDYAGDGLSEDEIAATPWLQARLWVEQAHARHERDGDVPEPTALSVATVNAAGEPNVRTVLMRFFAPAGPGFLSNLESAKGSELRSNPRIAAALTWPSMYRAIRFRGTAAALERDAVRDYFQSRPWASRISAWASRQSQPIADRAQLEATYERYAAQYPDRGRPDDVPVPDFWGGYRITCDAVEFWAGRRNRLHDRLVFTRTGDGDLDAAAAWTLTRRQP